MSYMLSIGLSMAEIKEMTIGMMYDLMIERYNQTVRAEKKMKGKDKKQNKPKVRKATQADFDRL